MAYHVECKEDVERIIVLARAAGVKIAKEPQDVLPIWTAIIGSGLGAGLSV